MMWIEWRLKFELLLKKCQYFDINWTPKLKSCEKTKIKKQRTRIMLYKFHLLNQMRPKIWFGIDLIALTARRGCVLNLKWNRCFILTFDWHEVNLFVDKPADRIHFYLKMSNSWQFIENWCNLSDSLNYMHEHVFISLYAHLRNENWHKWNRELCSCFNKCIKLYLNCVLCDA